MLSSGWWAVGVSGRGLGGTSKGFLSWPFGPALGVNWSIGDVGQSLIMTFGIVMRGRYDNLGGFADDVVVEKTDTMMVDKLLTGCCGASLAMGHRFVTSLEERWSKTRMSFSSARRGKSDKFQGSSAYIQALQAYSSP